MKRSAAHRFGRPIMPSRRVPYSQGFTLAELVIVIAVIGILAVMAVPSYLSYLRAAGLKSGAQQVVAQVNQAREVAIKETGNINLPAGITVTASANPIFNYVGSALPAATYTLTYTQTGATLTASVAAS